MGEPHSSDRHECNWFDGVGVMFASGLALRSSISQGWTPAILFLSGAAGGWIGGFVPGAPARFFQDAGGEQLAQNAGHPVGKVIQSAGSLTATQNVALSRPTLANWPKSGLRNILRGAQAVTNSAFWPENRTDTGVLMTRIATGLEEGVPYADFTVSGTSPQSGPRSLYLNSEPNRVLGLSGRVYSARASVRLLSGGFSAGGGMRLDIAVFDSQGTYLSTTSSDLVTSTNYVDLMISRLIPEGDNVMLSVSIGPRVNAAEVQNATVRVKGLRLEQGSILGPLQHNYGLNHVIEPSDGALWHLYNDGGDALPVVLPIGTYGLASVDIQRNVTVSSVVSDGTTAINLLRHERQLDLVLRQGAFSPQEEATLRQYWAEVWR